MKHLNGILEFKQWQDELIQSRDPDARTIVLCGGTGCNATGSKPVAEAIREQIDNYGLSDEVSLRITGCHGFCEKGPLMVVQPEGILYTGVKPEDVPEIMKETILNKKIIERLLYIDPVTGNKITYERDVQFYNKQARIIFGDNGRINPVKIEDYISIGGYQALAKTLAENNPDAVISMIKKSGLRGRGGGGFPAGIKWESCRKAHGSIKYVICNADEGDPGAYANRSLLEGNPHSVLEGMIIGAFAVGANVGYIYIRDEYPLAVELFVNAIRQAGQCGLIGRNILGSGFDFVMNVNRGGGAFVCGESSALMASLEGKIGEPRAKYIHMVERGLYERPSCLNNVETWANVPLILNKGTDWFTKIGTGDVSQNPWGGSKGTKIFSLVGKVNNTGLVEVPMGMTLREIVFGIGGGIRGGKKFKAIQTGGPSGGCIPEKFLDLPVDYDRLTQAGSMMGSGGMIVVDENTCMVDIAAYFLNFLKEESCGKCAPCREGIGRMHEILANICEGYGKNGDIELLEELAETVRDSSLCQLGATSPNPVLTTLKYFRDEYEAHIKDQKCPAGVCKALIHYKIDAQSCKGCSACLKSCPSEAISGEKKKPHVIDPEKCIRCGVCIDTCKFDSIRIIPGRFNAVQRLKIAN